MKSIFNSSSPNPKNHSAQIGTSTQQQQQVFWPQDYLAEDIAQARVWTYGYAADVIGGLFRASGKDSVSQHGRNLAVRLEREVDDEVITILLKVHEPDTEGIHRVRFCLWPIVWAAYLLRMYDDSKDFPVGDKQTLTLTPRPSGDLKLYASERDSLSSSEHHIGVAK